MDSTCHSAVALSLSPLKKDDILLLQSYSSLPDFGSSRPTNTGKSNLWTLVESHVHTYKLTVSAVDSDPVHLSVYDRGSFSTL